MPKRKLSDRLSLRQLLALPYAALILALALPIGTLTWREQGTVDSLSGRLLVEMVTRIDASLGRHVGGADAVLEAAFPAGLPAPEQLARDLDVLRQRFWLATSMHREPNNYVYYGDRRGHFIGLWRFSETEAELRLRTTDAGPRTLYRLSGIDGALRSPAIEDKLFEPRERLWYQSALAQPVPLAWTPAYVDFRTQELVVTRTKRIGNDVGEPEGVAATDLSLKQVNALLTRLPLTENAVAMVVEANGQLVGVSRGAHLKARAAGGLERLDARQSTDALVAGAFEAVHRHGNGDAGDPAGTPRTFSFRDADGRTVQVGYARLDPALGLDWLIVTAVPRSDLLADVQRNALLGTLLVAVAALAALAVGWAALGVVTRTLQRLGDAARRVGDGVLDQPPEVLRNDELGDLARSFADMQQRLLADELTGLYNRGAVLRRIENRILQQRRRGDRWPFAVIAIGLRGLDDINARFGHAVGDAVLQEIGQRLRHGVRIGDIVSRYAGDEFVLLLESVATRTDAEAVRAHLEAAMREPLRSLAGMAPAGAPPVTGFGVALYPDDGQDTETLLRHADADMNARRQDANAPPP